MGLLVGFSFGWLLFRGFPGCRLFLHLGCRLVVYGLHGSPSEVRPFLEFLQPCINSHPELLRLARRMVEPVGRPDSMEPPSKLFEELLAKAVPVPRRRSLSRAGTTRTGRFLAAPRPEDNQPECEKMSYRLSPASGW